MLYKNLITGDKIYLQDNTLLLELSSPGRAVSTSLYNGGFQENLQYIFNHHLPSEESSLDSLPGGSVEGYYKYIVQKNNLPYSNTTGLITSAEMENAAVNSADFKDLTVTAVITAGVDDNGGRIGDRAVYYEKDGKWRKITGTINIIVLINGNLPYYTLSRAVITATEAKTAALYDLKAPSLYSRGIATGSGTDGIVVACNSESSTYFTDAGKHSKLGELLGNTVYNGVLEALYKETGLNSIRQHSILERLKRYGITLEDFWEDFKKNHINITREEYEKVFLQIDGNENLVAAASSIVNLWDEYINNMLTEEAVVKTGINIIESLTADTGITATVEYREPVRYLKQIYIKKINKYISSSI